MPNSEQLIPDVDALLALAPEELASYLLEVAKSQLQNGGMFTIGNTLLSAAHMNPAGNPQSAYLRRDEEVELATGEKLLAPRSGTNPARKRNEWHPWMACD